VCRGKTERHFHQLIWLCIWELSNEEHVHRAEDRRRCADPDGEGKHGDGGERGTTAQAAHGVAKVVQEIVEMFVEAHASLPKVSGMVKVFADAIDVGAKSADGLEARVVVSHPSSHEGLDARRDDGVELLVDLGVDCVSRAGRDPEDPTYTRGKVEPAHAMSSSVGAQRLDGIDARGSARG